MLPAHVFNLKRERVQHAKPKLNFHLAASNLPPKVDLRPKCSPVRNQLNLGCCSGFASTACLEFDDPTNTFSPLFQYYNERKDDGDIPSDGGSTISESVRAAVTYGVCRESLWPYDPSKFSVRPSVEAYNDALQHCALEDRQVDQDVNSLKGCLASGFPIIFGFQVYASFESAAVAQTGIVPMPHPGEQCMGGHAVLCIGYDDVSQHWIVKNSWSESWGDHGYFYLPYAYLTNDNLSSDFWTITRIKTAQPVLLPVVAEAIIPITSPIVPTPVPTPEHFLPHPPPTPNPNHIPHFDPLIFTQTFNENFPPMMRMFNSLQFANAFTKAFEQSFGK